MNCDPVLRDLSRLLDGEPGRLSAAEREAHLASCADCRRFESDSVEFSDYYRSRVLSGIAALRGLEVAAAPRKRRRFWLVPAAAAVLLAIWTLRPAPRAPVASPSPVAAKPRSLLLELPRFFDEPDFELSRGSWREPPLPVRLNDDLLPVFDTPADLPPRLGF